MRRYTALTIFFLITFSFSVVSAQSTKPNIVQFVYRIKIDSCKFDPIARRQTGFRVKGLTGIVTALHGVADCTKISAVSDDGQEIFTDLSISQIDIERDVALLSSAYIKDSPSDGLVISGLTNTEIRKANLQIAGYPLGLEKQDIDINIVVRDIESLDDVIPDALEPANFIKRQSPDIDISVLNVQAHLLPGHSGAPLLDSNNHVVGIADGGLLDGTVGRGWAIPWQDVKLQSVELVGVKAKFTKLVQKDPSLALSFSTSYPNTKVTGSSTYVIRIANSANMPIPNAEVTLTHSEGYEIGFTDSEGFCIFSLSPTPSYQQSTILVEADGYLPYSRQLYDPLKKMGTEEFRLPDSLYLKVISPTSTPLGNISTPYPEKDDILGFKVIQESDSHITFRVDYNYISDHGNEALMSVQAFPRELRFGYGPSTIIRGISYTIVDLFYSPDGNEVAQSEASDKITFSMYNSKGTFYSETFHFSKIWFPAPTPSPVPESNIPNDISNFKPIEVTNSDLKFTVDYSYNTYHGDQVSISANVLQNDQEVEGFAYKPDNAERGDGTATIVLSCCQRKKERISSDQIEVVLYNSNGVFYSEKFEYTKTWLGTPPTVCYGLYSYQLDFSKNLKVGQQEPKILELSNCGTSPMLLNDIRITGIDANEFVLGISDLLGSDKLDNIVLPGLTACYIGVTFKPLSERDGERKAQLELSFNIERERGYLRASLTGGAQISQQALDELTIPLSSLIQVPACHTFRN